MPPAGSGRQELLGNYKTHKDLPKATICLALRAFGHDVLAAWSSLSFHDKGDKGYEINQIRAWGR